MTQLKTEKGNIIAKQKRNKNQKQKTKDKLNKSMENLLLWSRFVDVSKRYPDKTAISYESKKVTYHDLYLRACYLSSLISNKTENNEKPLRVAILIDRLLETNHGTQHMMCLACSPSCPCDF